MNIILAVGILLIIVSFATRKSKYAPLIGFAFVFLIMGFQSNVEGDYMSYMEDYNQMFSGGAAESRTFEDEPIFPFLFKFFSLFSPWWLFVIFISLFQTSILIRLVEKYSPKQNQFIAAILFFFTFNMMLLQMKAMRQAFAIELMVLAIMEIDKATRMKAKSRIPWIAILVASMAYFTHNSAALMFPFLLLFYIVKRHPEALTHSGNSIIFPIIVTCAYLFLYVIKVTFLNQYLIGFAMLDEDFRLARYLGEEELENQFDISWLIVMYDAVIVFLVAWSYKFADSKMRVFSWISIVAAFFDMLFFGIGSLVRMQMYFVVYNLVVYPHVAVHIRKKFGNIAVLVFIVFLLGYAIKTSYPWIIGVDNGRFGTYQFVFCQ